MLRGSGLRWLAVLAVMSVSTISMGRVDVRAQIGPGTPATVVLEGHVHPTVASGAARSTGHHNPDDQLRISLVLNLRSADALQSFLASSGNPYSPSYHRTLTLDQENALYNPTPDAEQQVTSWLQQKGLAVTAQSANHLVVTVTGSTTTVEHAFGVQIDDYTMTRGTSTVSFYATSREPTLPAFVGSLVHGIVGLDNFPHPNHAFTDGNYSLNPPYYPQDIATAYDITGLWNGGWYGSGQHIAILLDEQATSDAALTTWTNNVSVGNTNKAQVATRANARLHLVHVDGGTTCAALDPEPGIDIEAESTSAPYAQIYYYDYPSTSGCGSWTSQGVVDAANMAGSDANNNLEISMSWGECEGFWSQSDLTSLNTVFMDNAATGHNYLAASGDAGAYNGCGNTPDVNFPASSPWVTAVGGTQFISALNGSRSGEEGWPLSGGGYSSVFGGLSYQYDKTTQTGCGSPPTYCRAIPDVSAIAGDPNVTYPVYICWDQPTGTLCTGTGGTSYAAPLWAGILADTNQYLNSLGQPLLGYANPSLYAIEYGLLGPFHDITGKSNGKYSAVNGWDQVTGLGSPDAWNLARSLPAAISFEAETDSVGIPNGNVLSGGAYVTSCIPCSNGKGVILPSIGAATQVMHVNVGSNGYYTLAFDYTNTNAAAGQVSYGINGPSRGPANLPYTGTNAVATVLTNIHLSAGDNWIQVTETGSTSMSLTLDRLRIIHNNTSYEAESLVNVLSGSAAITYCSVCSGSYNVTGIGNNSGTLTFKNVNISQGDVAGGYNVIVSYTNPDSTARSAVVDVNGGDEVVTASFPPTGAGVVKKTTVSWQPNFGFNFLSSSNTIKFSNSSGPGPDIDRIELQPTGKRIYEAEATGNVLTGSAVIISCSTTCSGGARVGGLGYNPSTGSVGSLTFTGLYAPISSTSYTVLVKYINPDVSGYRAADLSLDGATPTKLEFSATAGYISSVTVSIPFTYSGPQGGHSLQFYNSTALAPDIDSIQVQ